MPRNPTPEEIEAQLERMREAERRKADDARKRRERIRRQERRLANARRTALAREATDFWEKLPATTRTRLRGGDVPQVAVVLLGLTALDRLATSRFPSQNLRAMLKDMAEETEDPDERQEIRRLLEPNPTDHPY